MWEGHHLLFFKLFNMASTATRIVYGQAFVSGDSLVQDQLLMVQMPNGSASTSENHVVLIPNIWEDLKKATGTYIVKQVKDEFWYWDDEKLVMTDMETEKPTKIKVQIPRPSLDIFRDPKTNALDLEEKDGDSDWVKFWKERLSKHVNSPYNSINAISPVEVTFPESSYLDQNGNVVKKDAITFRRDDLSDLDNLLMTMF